MVQHETVTVTYTDEAGVEQSTDMVQANFTTHGHFSFMKWHLCAICSWAYREDRMRKIDGVWYCNKKGHWKDAPRFTGRRG